MYLKQHGVKISGSKAELTERARGNAARDVVQAEEFNDSCKESEFRVK